VETYCCRETAPHSVSSWNNRNINVYVFHHSLTDNLPVATKFMVDKKVHYENGYRLGYVDRGKVLQTTVS